MHEDGLNLRNAQRAAGAAKAPVSAGDELLLEYRITGRSVPTQARVELVEWRLPELILGGDYSRYPWKIGYRILSSGDHPNQFGVVWLGDDGADETGAVRIRREQS